MVRCVSGPISPAPREGEGKGRGGEGEDAPVEINALYGGGGGKGRGGRCRRCRRTLGAGYSGARTQRCSLSFRTRHLPTLAHFAVAELSVDSVHRCPCRLRQREEAGRVELATEKRRRHAARNVRLNAAVVCTVLLGKLSICSASIGPPLEDCISSTRSDVWRGSLRCRVQAQTRRHASTHTLSPAVSGRKTGNWEAAKAMGLKATP